MKKILLVAFLVLLGFILFNRVRTYIRDPLASVYVDGQKQHGVQVYINYLNDVLLIREEQPGAYSLLVQNWSKMPGTPTELRCVHLMACMTDAEKASTIPVVPNTNRHYDPKTDMTSRQVSYFAPDGKHVQIQLW